MPELPEVETIRRDLEPLVRGRRITAVEVDAATLPLLAGVPLTALEEGLVGRTITALDRAGKHLLFRLDNGRTWAAHLRMTGRLVWRPEGAAPENYERAALAFDNGFGLRWCDLRKFGRWQLVATDAEATGELGPEPSGPGFTAAALGAALAGRRAPVKAVLLDQRRVAGIGNIYADEALFAAGVHPATPAGELPEAAVARLHAACRQVIARGIENRGASFRDYVDGQGNPGTQHMYVQVFRRQGKPCYTCGTTIERTVVAGRGTHHCPHCQPRAAGACEPQP